MKYLLPFIITFFAFAKAYTQEISPQTSVVDVQTIDAQLTIDFDSESVAGSVITTFKMLNDADSVALDAQNMTVVDQTPLFDIVTTDSTIVFKGNFKAGGVYKAFFDYTVKPDKAAYFVNNEGSSQFWTQGQGKYTSNWLPSLDDMNDKIVFTLVVSEDIISDRTVIANGKTLKGETTKKSFSLDKPISSYLVATVAGDYAIVRDTTASGIPLEYYYYPEDSIKVEPTYRYSKRIFDFLENEIGVPYPWEVYKQVPVKDFLYAGMENASLTVFSDNFVVDSIGYKDRNYLNVNAHELAHQWFGDLVTETKSDHHWLHEGFATYYALLAEREIFGEDYFYFKLFESAEELRALSDSGKGQKLVAPGGSSLTYYQKGAWAVHILRELVGDTVFKTAVKNFLIHYKFQNVTTQDFLSEVEALTEVDLTDFKKNWLYQSAFQAEDALASLKKSSFMQQYFQLQSGREVPLSSKYPQLMTAIETGNDYLGVEAVYQLSEESINAVLPAYRKALQNDNLYIRQAVAVSLESIPEQLVLDFYKLLSDKSYLTREQAMIKLWVYHQQRNDPESQRKVLDLMDSQFGFADGNIRTLWLALSLATPNYKTAASVDRYQELIDYTALDQPYQLRENAFNYLRQLNSFEVQSIKSLVEASVHHVWRFRESARKILQEQITNPKVVTIIKKNRDHFSSRELAYLKRIEVF